MNINKFKKTLTNNLRRPITFSVGLRFIPDVQLFLQKNLKYICTYCEPTCGVRNGVTIDKCSLFSSYILNGSVQRTTCLIILGSMS
ncbi:hypothetical protein V1478_011844 [Vespula squamosa]|uniref:Uncharacterized protein n=1 Tax=Vespula squamosa TaxID=30214 RepID=A0ABD2ABI3_VESSQ